MCDPLLGTYEIPDSRRAGAQREPRVYTGRLGTGNPQSPVPDIAEGQPCKPASLKIEV